MIEYERDPYEAPALDIASWLARLHLTNQAFRESRPGLFCEDWGDSGQPIWTLAETSRSMDEAMANPIFEEEVLRGVYRCLPLMNDKSSVSRVVDLLDASDTLPDDQQQRIETIGKKAAQVGLKRLGLIEQTNNSYAIPPAAYAALAYHRADIRNPYDRVLYAREPEFTPLVGQLLIRPREVDATYVDPSAEADRVVTMLRYRYITLADSNYLKRLGYETVQEAWWGELSLDLDRIDNKSAQIGASLAV